MRIYFFILISCVFLNISCSGKENQKISIAGKKLDENQKSDTELTDSKGEISYFDESTLKSLNEDIDIKINNLILDEDSISEYVVRGFLYGEDYSVLINLISYRDIIVLLISRDNSNKQKQIAGSSVIRKKQKTWEITHMQIKKSGQIRKDIVVIVDGSESNTIVESFLINLKTNDFSPIDYSDIKLQRIEF